MNSGHQITPIQTAFGSTDASRDSAVAREGGPSLHVALGEYDTGWHDPRQSLERAASLAREARLSGAELLVLPEMCTTGFTMDAEQQAEVPDGTSVRTLATIAAEERIWIIAGLAMRRENRFVNSALLIAPTGEVTATYNKQRLFGYAAETEIYSAGAEPCIVEIAGLSVALFICFDLRFPELFREVGPDVDACVVIANWPAARQLHWDVLIQARAIENQCYVVAVNRTGEGGGLRYDGGSRIFDPWGERTDAADSNGVLRTGTLKREAVDQVRTNFPFVPDRRPVTHATASRNS